MADTYAYFNKLKGLKIICLNIRSLINKIDELKYYISLLKPNIICICETWLNSDIYDSEINIEGYSVYRCDRKNNKKGRGIGIFVRQKSTLECYIVDNNSDIEELTIRLKFVKSKQFFISCVYRPPNEINFNEKYLNFINKFRSKEHIIFGDFNYDLNNNENNS